MFEKLLKKLLFIFICSGSVAQAAIPNIDHPTSFVGPTAQGKYTRDLAPNAAVSVLGEAGPRNYRAGATLGWLLNDHQRFKISGEYLTQDIVYAFFSGNSREWVEQGAVGAQYQYDMDYAYLPQFNLKGGYSHAPNKQLTPVSGTFTNGLGLPQNFIDLRRIAGSDAGYISPGLSIQPWKTGRVGVELNYDDVQYNKIYAFNNRAQGFGGSANLIQQLSDTTELGVGVGIRQPFNVYQANIAYTPPSYPDVTISLNGNYVQGKVQLPNTYNVGISISYLVSEGPVTSNKLGGWTSESGANNRASLWAAEPAIYVPQVLAVADEQVSLPVPPPVCNAPTLTGTIANQSTVTTINVPTAGVFSGTTPFTYDVSFSGAPAGTTVTIDSAGVVTITPFDNGTNYIFNVTVTATNSCGSVPTTFQVEANFDD